MQTKLFCLLTFLALDFSEPALDILRVQENNERLEKLSFVKIRTNGMDRLSETLFP